MKKTTMYRYLGVNGIINSPILLENTPHITNILLTADSGNVLTKDGENFCYSTTVVSEEEAALWREVKGKSN